MTKSIDAIYENGMFRPLEDTGLPDGEQVRLTISDWSDQPTNIAQAGVQETQIEQRPEVPSAPLSRTLTRLALDPAFEIPTRPIAFDPVEPIQGTGQSASDLLLEDRR